MVKNTIVVPVKKGDNFSIECPDKGHISAYNYNTDIKGLGSSLYGGIGPFYCSDGTVINRNFGKN